MENIKEESKQTSEEPRKAMDRNTDLAIERTQLAVERTQLAWVRTIMGMITGGVAIDKGFTALHEARVLAGTAWVKNGHFAGLLLTITGTLLMIFASLVFIKNINQLDRMGNSKRKLPTAATILSIFVCLLGGLAIYFLSISW